MYYVKLTAAFACVNKLQEEVQEYLRGTDGTLVSTDALDEYTWQIVCDINKITDKHPRCRPIKAGFRKVNQSYVITGVEATQIILYSVKRVFKK